MIKNHYILTSRLEYFKLFQYRPGTRVYAINMFEVLSSIVGLWEQVAAIGDKYGPILKNTSSDGVVLVSYSQGKLNN